MGKERIVWEPYYNQRENRIVKRLLAGGFIQISSSYPLFGRVPKRYKAKEALYLAKRKELVGAYDYETKIKEVKDWIDSLSEATAFRIYARVYSRGSDRVLTSQRVKKLFKLMGGQTSNPPKLSEVEETEETDEY